MKPIMPHPPVAVADHAKAFVLGDSSDRASCEGGQEAHGNQQISLEVAIGWILRLAHRA